MQKGSVNKVVLVGHLGGDPETRFTPSGTAVANFNLATNQTWRDTNGELLKKGQLCYLEGKLQTRNWEDKDGVKRYTTEVICDIFTMLGRRIDNQNGQEQNQNEQGQAAPVTADGDDEDDLPF